MRAGRRVRAFTSAYTASASGRMDFDSETFVTHSLRGEGYGIAVHSNMARIFARFGILAAHFGGGGIGACQSYPRPHHGRIR